MAKTACIWSLSPTTPAVVSLCPIPPRPWPWPHISSDPLSEERVTPEVLALSGLEFLRAAENLDGHPLQQTFADAAEQLFDVAAQRQIG